MVRMLLFVAVLAALGAGRAAATPSTPFLGTWWSIDSSDGSLEQATFGADGHLYFRDDSAHTCGGVQAFLTDVGAVDGSTWTGSGEAVLRCPSVGKTIPGVFFQFTLDPDGTLSSTDSSDLWYRARP